MRNLNHITLEHWGDCKPMEEFLDFRVIKEKIIKTDSIINLFLDSKRKNAGLKKILEQTHRKYKQSIDDITILKLENDRKSHQSEEEIRQCENIKNDYAKLKLDYCSVKEDYNSNLNELQVLQIKYQSTCKELLECQKSVEQYKNISNVLPVKAGKSKKSKKNYESLEISEANELRNCSSFSASETAESDDEGRLLEMKLTGKVEHKTEQNNWQSKKHPKSIEEINNKSNETIISDLKTEIEQLSSISNELKEEIKECNGREDAMNKEWKDILRNKEAAWSETEKKLRFEVAELKKRLEFYERKNSMANIKKSIFDCQEESEELANCISKQHMSDLQSQEAVKVSHKELDNIGVPEIVCELPSFSECDLPEQQLQSIFDNRIQPELPSLPECDLSESESVSDDINDIFTKMRMTSLVSPMPPSEEDELHLENNSTEIVSTKLQLSSENISITIEPESKCHIPVKKSNDVQFENDKFNKLRQLKAKRLGNLLNIKKAKHLLWMRKSRLILKSENDNAEESSRKSVSYGNDTDKSMKKNEEEMFHTKNTSVDDIVTVLAELVSQKLRYPRPRRKQAKLNQVDDSKNVLEVNRMLLKKARQLITTSNSCEQKDDSKEIMECDYKDHFDISRTIHPDALVLPPIELVSVEHLSTACLSERSSSEVELPLFDSCYDSLISNPPSIENIDEKKSKTEWLQGNRFVSDNSNAEGCQTENFIVNKGTVNSHSEMFRTSEQDCNNQDSSKIVSKFNENPYSSLSSKTAENNSGDHNFKVKGEVINSLESITCNVKNRITRNNQLETNSSYQNEANCLHDGKFEVHEMGEIQKYCHIARINGEVDRRMDQKSISFTLEPENPIVQNVEIFSDTQIQSDSRMKNDKNNSSQNSSELKINGNEKLISENYEPVFEKINNIHNGSSNNSDASDEGTNGNKLIRENNDKELIKTENTITVSNVEFDNLRYQKEKDGIIQTNVEKRYNYDNYKELLYNERIHNENVESSESSSDSEAHTVLQSSVQIQNYEIKEIVKNCQYSETNKKDLADNQKLVSLESQNQSNSITQNTIQMICGNHNDNSNEFIQENQIVEFDHILIDKSHRVKHMDSFLLDNLQTHNKNSEINIQNNHDISQVIYNEKSIITSTELLNTELQKVEECQLENFKQSSIHSDKSLEFMKKDISELNDDPLSDGILKNESEVISLHDNAQDSHLGLNNDAEATRMMNSPMTELETEDGNNCYKLFHYDYDDTSWNSTDLNITETVQIRNWDEQTNRSNESMWYEFSNNILPDIRISKSYNGNDESHVSTVGNIDCKIDGSNKTISIKRHSEDELPNISKFLKLVDCDFSIDPTNNFEMELTDSSEIKLIDSKSKTNGEVVCGEIECPKSSQQISTKKQNENAMVTPNETLLKKETDRIFHLGICDKLNSSNNMEIDLNISQHLLYEIEEEYLNDDSSVCVSSIINDLICESQKDTEKNYVRDNEISDTLIHHLVNENEPELPDSNENCSEKCSSTDTKLISSEISENYGNSSISRTQPLLHSGSDVKSSSPKKVCKNSNKKSRVLVRKYDLRKPPKFEEENVVSAPVTKETLENESSNTSNENNNFQEVNKDGYASLNSIKSESIQSFKKEIDLIGSFSESSDNELADPSFSDKTTKNAKASTLKKTRKSNNCRVQAKKKIKSKVKKGVLMKKSIKTYRQKNLASSSVGMQIAEKDTEITCRKPCSTEEKSGNNTLTDNPLNVCKSCQNNTSELESNHQEIKTYSDSIIKKKHNVGERITDPQSSLFKRIRSSSGSYSITSIRKTCASGSTATKTKKELNSKKTFTTSSLTEDRSGMENKPKLEKSSSSNDFQNKIDSLGLGDISPTSCDKQEKVYDISVKKVRKSLVDVINGNEHSTTKVVKKTFAPRKRKSSTDVVHNIEHENTVKYPQSVIISNKRPLSINNISVSDSCSKEGKRKEEKINILQEVIFKPSSATMNCTKLELKAPTQMRISGFKRPNNTKIIPSCPQSPPPPSADETDSHAQPIIIPLEKPPKMDPSKAAALFRKLITYSKEEKTVEEVVRQFTSQDVDHIARLILEQITQDTEKANKDNSSAPLMTDTQRVMLGFMLKLESMNVHDLINTYLNISEITLLQANTLQEVDTITRLHVAICKSHKYIQRMRRMCCDAFYFMGDLAIPFFFIVLVSWIEVLPMEGEVSDFPIVKVLIQLVNLKDCNIPGYNLLHLRDLLNKYYNYPIEPWNSNIFFQELFNNYLKNPVRPSDFGILLYCKNNASKWVYEKINNLLKPTLLNIRNENFKATVIILVGNIISQFNGKVDGEYVDSIRQWFKSMIAEEDISEVVKKSIILSLRKLPKIFKKSEIGNIAKKK